MEHLNQTSLDAIARIIEQHQNKEGPVKLILHDIQRACGYIPVEALPMIASACHKPVAEIYGVVSFYAQFSLKPKGKHVLSICMGTACYVKGAQALIAKFQALTNAELNQTSADGLFSLDTTRCLGACGLAPVAVLDGVVYADAIHNPNLEFKIRELIHEHEMKAQGELNA